MPAHQQVPREDCRFAAYGAGRKTFRQPSQDLRYFIMSIRNILRILAFAAPLCFALCRAASSLPTPTPAQTLLSQETPTIVLRPTPLVPTEELAGHPTCFVPKEILPFAFSPDGVRLFVRTSSGVQILNLDTGKEEAFIEASQSLVVAALSPDGQTLAWSLEDNSIQLIRLSDQLVSHIFEGHPTRSTTFASRPVETGYFPLLMTVGSGYGAPTGPDSRP